MHVTTSLATVTDLSVRGTPRHVRQHFAPISLRKLSIIIPCYNEAPTIAVILDKVTDVILTHNIDKEIIVVNDCSKDDTDLMIQEYISDNPEAPIRYVRHAINKGKGASVNTGLQLATGDYTLIQDADL